MGWLILIYHLIVILGHGGFGQIYLVEEKKENTEEKTEPEPVPELALELAPAPEPVPEPEIVVKIVLRDEMTESSTAAERNVFRAFSNLDGYKSLVKNIAWDSTFILRSIVNARFKPMMETNVTRICLN